MRHWPKKLVNHVLFPPGSGALFQNLLLLGFITSDCWAVFAMGNIVVETSEIPATAPITLRTYVS